MAVTGDRLTGEPLSDFCLFPRDPGILDRLLFSGCLSQLRHFFDIARAFWITRPFGHVEHPPVRRHHARRRRGGKILDRVTFTLAGKELDDATAWRLTHSCDPSSPRIPGAPDGYQVDFGYEYTFIPCGPGTAVIIRCQRCGRSRNVTDFEAW